jgi:hypothetical protein
VFGYFTFSCRCLHHRFQSSFDLVVQKVSFNFSCLATKDIRCVSMVNKRKKTLSAQVRIVTLSSPNWSKPISCSPSRSGFLCLHDFRGLLLRNGLRLTRADTNKTLELFHKDEHQNSIRPISHPKVSLCHFRIKNSTLTQV